MDNFRTSMAKWQVFSVNTLMYFGFKAGLGGSVGCASDW